MAQRTALVTGGSRGIGAAITARLINDGWRVVIADQDVAPVDAPLNTPTDALRTQAVPGAAASIRTVACDVGDEAAIERLIASVAAEEGQLDALVCNAGIMIRKPIGALLLSEWSRVISTNLTSTFLLVRAAETLLRAAHGSVLTIASTRAHMSEPHTEAYAASKGGLVALTHALAVSLGPEIRVNCISPGWILTKGPKPTAEEHAFHPAGRVGTSDDIAALAAFLLGPESRFITGAEFVVDGGVTRKMIYPE